MRLIDADALTMLLHDDIDGLDEEFPNDKQVKPYMCGVKMALSFIDIAPTIDAVPVVRCKDCKWSIKDDWICGHPNNNAWNISTEHYCGYGERKDDDKSYDTCKHHDKGWDDIVCDGCTKAHSNWERRDDD